MATGLVCLSHWVNPNAVWGQLSQFSYSALFDEVRRDQLGREEDMD